MEVAQQGFIHILVVIPVGQLLDRMLFDNEINRVTPLDSPLIISIIVVSYVYQSFIRFLFLFLGIQHKLLPPRFHEPEDGDQGRPVETLMTRICDFLLSHSQRHKLLCHRTLEWRNQKRNCNSHFSFSGFKSHLLFMINQSSIAFSFLSYVS